jgi:two-component system sensor histidine kinase DesK
VPSLPAAVDVVLGWVVREATTNVLRHSSATEVTVALAVDPLRTRLTVADDGVGPTAPPGAGLAGLAERVAALGGRLESGPGPGRGFRLAAELPLTAGAAAEPVSSR